jgi:hypothetical protein
MVIYSNCFSLDLSSLSESNAGKSWKVGERVGKIRNFKPMLENPGKHFLVFA